MRAFVNRWRWVCLISCVAVVAVALPACGSDEPAPDTAPAQPTAASMSQPTVAPATQAPSTVMSEPTAAPTVAPATQAPSTAMPEPTAVPTVAAATESAAPSVDVGLDVGQRAPDFTLTSHEGESITRASLEGRPVLLYFYTTW